MSGARNQEATPKRVREARRRGDVAVSRELTSAAAFAGGVGALLLTSRATAVTLAAGLRVGLTRAGEARAFTVGPELLDAVTRLGRVAAAPLVAAAVAAAVCGALQTRGLLSVDAAAPRWSRLNPAAGLRRSLGGGQLASCAIGLLKVAATLAVAWSARDQVAAAVLAAAAAPSGAGALTAAALVAGRLAARLVPVLVAFGALDLALARRRHARALRMTLEEVRREQKEQDGDPQHKTERRRLHRSLADAIPIARATCVVVNPTHLSVALHHDAHADGAPVVIAKGSGREAARIRGEALRSAVPVVRDVPLARALFRLADVGDEIPEELYDAAAAVLVHVHGVAPVVRR